MPRIDLDGLRLHYVQSGAGRDVVLLHGFTGNLAVWMFSGILQRIAASFRVTALDLRGHGASDVPHSGYTSAHYAADLLALHERLCLGPAFLVGHSFGGVVAVHAALLAPERVAGIVLSDSFFPGLAEVEPDAAQAGPWQDLREPFGRLGVELGERIAFPALFAAVRALDERQRGRLEQVFGPAGARWVASMGSLAGTTAGEELFEVAGLTRERICSLEQPVAALYDERSPFHATERFLARELRRCEVETLPGAKHFAPLENPDAFAGAVLRHLARMAAEPPPV